MLFVFVSLLFLLGYSLVGFCRYRTNFCSGKNEKCKQDMKFDQHRVQKGSTGSLKKILISVSLVVAGTLQNVAVCLREHRLYTLTAVFMFDNAEL